MVRVDEWLSRCGATSPLTRLSKIGNCSINNFMDKGMSFTVNFKILHNKLLYLVVFYNFFILNRRRAAGLAK